MYLTLRLVVSALLASKSDQSWMSSHTQINIDILNGYLCKENVLPILFCFIESGCITMETGLS